MQMFFKVLGRNNVNEHVEYLKIAMSEEPEIMALFLVEYIVR